ncbi:SUMF1/EgtB/PvdO family nonheme iron enzyme [Anaerolineales bacterium HSG6]|nr:SUMF1/EgtB/PvdO family nonheme iron enzyme [Anaerolineales bacterium HSG6]
MKKSRYIMPFLLIILMGCGSFSSEQPVAAENSVNQFVVEDVIPSGEYEERVEREEIPINACDSQAQLTRIVERSRTLEESVSIDYSASSALSGGASVGLKADLTVSVGTTYGFSQGTSKTDSSGFELPADPGTYPTYTILWKERWEKGNVVVREEGTDKKIPYPYVYLKSAKPEIEGTKYTDCPQNEADNSPADTPQRQAPVNMMLIPAGEFTMGSEQRDNEKPVRQVYVDNFYIDPYEVTNNDYRSCVEAGECEAPTTCRYGDPTYNDDNKGNHPVVCTNWYQATAYCEWADKRLPTEAEWEKAARGTDGRTYPWGNDAPTCERMNYHDGVTLCVGETMPVGSYPEGISPYGLYDMSGNAEEWVQDCYDGDFYQTSSRTNPVNDSCNDADFWSFRSSSWSKGEYDSRSARRRNLNPSLSSAHLGFRCVQ